MINLTLLIQMIHFGIAYWLLDSILLRHVIKLVQQEQAIDAQIEETIKKTQHTLVLHSAEKQQRWHEMQHQLLQQRPMQLPAAYIRCAVPTAQIRSLSEHEVATLVAQLKLIVAERLTHD